MREKDLLAQIMAPEKRAERRREEMGVPQDTLEKDMKDQVRAPMDHAKRCRQRPEPPHENRDGGFTIRAAATRKQPPYAEKKKDELKWRCTRKTKKTADFPSLDHAPETQADRRKAQQHKIGVSTAQEDQGRLIKNRCSGRRP